MSDELSPSQAAARIGATTRSVQRWIASGRLPARRVGGRWRVATDAIDAFVASDGTTRRRTAGDHHADPDPVHRQPGRDRDTDHADVRAPRDPGGRPGHGRPRRRSTCSTSTRSWRLRGPPERTRSTRASASWPRTRTSPRRSAPPGSAGSGRRRRRSGRWATRLPRVGWPPRSDVPILAGYDDPDQSDEALLAAADPGRLPDAGQAGRRRRRQGHADGPRAAPAGGGDRRRARREAAAAFGDDRLILERLVVGARHVEIQVLFDGYGARRVTSANATARSSAATRRCSRRRRRRP